MALDTPSLLATAAPDEGQPSRSIGARDDGEYSGDDDNSDYDYDLTVHFHGQPTQLKAPSYLSVAGFAKATSVTLSIDETKLKLMIAPKPGILKHPFPENKLLDLITPRTKVTIFGSTNKEINGLHAAVSRSAGPRRLPTRPAAAWKRRDWKKIQEESAYTFHSIRPLTYLPNPERSQRFLERLANDPGIKSSMRKHKFSVGLLTEMNPAEHTTEESRTLGLNRNRGEVIELRLRTDRYDGYRDYKVIRKTLCHELSHNVWGEHDRNFWDLTKQIEIEVDRNDFNHGGHQLTQGEFYNPQDHGAEEEHFDGGGWTGGEFVLGSENSSGSQGLSRREIIANATVSRLEKERQAAKRSRKESHESEEAQGNP